MLMNVSRGEVLDTQEVECEKVSKDICWLKFGTLGTVPTQA